MALTPGNLDTMVTIGEVVEVETAASQPSRTYAVNWQTGRVSGTVDSMDALKQAIYKIFQTERFAHLIYSWNYGFEANRLIGQSAAFLRSEIQRLVTEALLAVLADMLPANILLKLKSLIPMATDNAPITPAVGMFTQVQHQSEPIPRGGR